MFVRGLATVLRRPAQTQPVLDAREPLHLRRVRESQRLDAVLLRVIPRVGDLLRREGGLLGAVGRR